MKFLKYKRIEVRQPKVDSHPEKTTTNNHDWRVGLFIIFEDYKGDEYDYMPKWNDLVLINQGKDTVEKVNKELAKEVKNEAK